MDFTLIVGSNQRCSLRINLLVDCEHHSLLEAFCNDLRSLEVHLLGQVVYSDVFKNIN